jgi:hypothetical protein
MLKLLIFSAENTAEIKLNTTVSSVLFTSCLEPGKLGQYTDEVIG